MKKKRLHEAIIRQIRRETKGFKLAVSFFVLDFGEIRRDLSL